MSTKTMRDVRAEIEEQRRHLNGHSFLRRLEVASDIEDLRRFMPHLYFYVFAFQDMLRLSDQLIRDPALKEISTRHREEDAGHQVWFAQDAVQLAVERDVVWVFGPEHEPTRDASYSLIAEIMGAHDDRVRLTLPLVLEAAGSTFFYRVNGLLARSGDERPLRYFSRSHQQVEADHDIFTEAGSRALDAIEFDDASYDVAIATVRRCFAAFDRLASHLQRYLDAPAVPS